MARLPGIAPDSAPLPMAIDMQQAPDMLIKIYGGTRLQEAPNLCETCRCSRIVRGRRNDEELVFCDAMAMETVRIGFAVTTCSAYIDSRLPSFHELLEKAWVLTPGSRRRAAGFVKGSELEGKDLHRFMKEHGQRE
jgi:hypothetical protein